MPTYVYPFVLIYEAPALRPCLPIRLYNPHEPSPPGASRLLETYCLADTGADTTMMPKWVAENTGHNLNGVGVSSTLSQGIAGMDVRTWKHTFIVSLLDPDNYQPIWQSGDMLIDCAEHDNVPPLLGSSNFLSNFRITFDYPSSCCVVEF